MMHRLAFGHLSLQFTAADIEKHAFAGDYEGISIEKPIFITSLPRAGTTLMLEALFRLPSLATQVYRDMPFVLAPLLWSRLSGAFRKDSDLKERAHGDGMRVGFDTPEAFEEIVWHAFWSEKYSETRIELWKRHDEKEDATAFIVDHMKKIIALRCHSRKGGERYMSKNNANIARIDLIKYMFPEANLLIPIRNPFEQAASLLRQHKNFLKMHQSEPFVRKYMKDIGHYEFGDLHRPIAFPGLSAWISNFDPRSINYWVAYWIAAYEYVLSRRDSVILFSYEQTCLNAESELCDILEQMNINPEGMLDSISTLFRHPPPTQVDPAEVDPLLREAARELHHELLSN
jgi:hypothetical protein